jgi:prepilin-type processing-associated H-X9-DG protein
MVKVTDGLSNTIMLIEQAGRPDQYLRGVWQKFVSPQGNIWISDKIGGNITATDLTCAMNCDNFKQPYSFHTGGCNFLFGDCSVHFIQPGCGRGAAVRTRDRARWRAGRRRLLRPVSFRLSSPGNSRIGEPAARTTAAGSVRQQPFRPLVVLAISHARNSRGGYAGEGIPLRHSRESHAWT